MADNKIGPIELEYLINNSELEAASRKAEEDINGTADTAEKAEKRVLKASSALAKQTGDIGNIVNSVGNEYKGLLEGGANTFTQLDKKVQSQVIQLVDMQQELRLVSAAQKDLDTRLKEGTISATAHSKAIASLALKEQELRGNIKKTTTDLKGQSAALGGHRAQFNGLSNSINQISRELPAFTYSAQTGLLAISNNIPILVDEIARLKVQNEALVASGQKGVPVLQQIGKAFFSWQTLLSGLIAVVTIAGPRIFEFFRGLLKGSESLDAVAKSQEAVNKAFESTDYKKAVASIEELRSVLLLATDDVEAKQKAIDLYNESIGAVSGEVTTLNEVELGLQKNADTFILMTLKKAAAYKLLEDAASNAIELQRAYDRDAAEFANTGDQISDATRSVGVGPGAQVDYDAIFKAEADRNERRKQEVIDKLESDQQDIRNLANKFLKEANDLAQQLGGGLFTDENGNINASSIVKSRQRLLDRIADLDREYARKRLNDDAAEVQALKDKFAKIREEIERFNADEKNEVKIDVSQLDGIEEQATDDLLKRQAEARADARQKKIDAELKAEQEQYKKLLEQLMTYQDKKLAIENDYADKLVLLAEKYQGEEFDKKLAELTRQKDEELQVLDDAAFKSSQIYRDLNEKVLGMTRQQIVQQMNLLKQALNEGFFTAADGTAMKLTQEQREELEKVIASLGIMLDEKKGENAQKLAQDLSKIGGALNNLSSALEDINPELAATLETMGDLAQVGADAANAVASFQSGDIAGGIASTINAVAGIFTIGAKTRESARQAREELKKIQAEAEDGERRLNALQRERNLLKARELELTLSSLAAQRQALLVAQRQINSESAQLFEQLQGQSFISGSRTEKYGGFLGIGRKTRVVNEYSSLLGKTYEEIEALYERGKLQDRAKELFEELRRLKEEGVNVQQQLADLQDQANQIFTGTTSEAISDGIINGFKNGYRTVEDFAGDLETMLRDAMLNGLKFKLLEPAIEKFYKQFADFAESDGGLSASELDQLREQYEGIVGDFLDKAGAIDQLTGGAGASQQRGLVGSIRRDLTEETGSELAGLYRAQYDITKRHFELDEKWFAAEMAVRTEILQLTVAIEFNTRMTHLTLVDAVSELSEIKKNTKPSSSARDNGYGG